MDSYGLAGEDILADIASDYFEDYVNYRCIELNMENEDFIQIIKRIPNKLE
ncbi:MAG: hypothetical protein LIP04_05265 [Tannerellaceae bacterium]|nr:hypothetical protein [Tannerellaceae bacterium]